MKNQPVQIAIAGGGFCGVLTAINLARHSRNPLHVRIYNAGAPFGRGIAYNTRSENHLLNVPAGKMSCFPDQPDHFTQWLQKQNGWEKFSAEELKQAWVPRKLYGDYLQEVWNGFVNDQHSSVSVEIVSSRITEVQKTNSYQLKTEDGQTASADYFVLAHGNEAPANLNIAHPEFYRSENYFRNPWNPAAVQDIPPGDILIIGNGLTMVDTVLDLIANGCTGRIWSVSRHGFSILPHRLSGEQYTGLLSELKLPCDLLTLFRLFRKHMKIAAAAGWHEEAVVDSVRNHSQEIWQNLSLTDKQRFITHLRHLWGYARHRLPASVFSKIDTLKNEGRLKILKGRLTDLQESEGKIRAAFFNPVSGKEEKLEIVRVINCTGPLTDISRSENAMLRQMQQAGLIQPDALRLGIAAVPGGAVVHGNGSVSEDLFTLGSSLRGLLWESTAVPELRVQAEMLARLICDKAAIRFNQREGVAG